MSYGIRDTGYRSPRNPTERAPDPATRISQPASRISQLASLSRLPHPVKKGFGVSKHAERRERLRRLVRGTGAAGFLVTHPANVTYLTGFTGDSSYLLLMPYDALMISDGRYTQQLAEECPELDTEIRRPGVEMLPMVAQVVGAIKLGSLAIEAASMTVAFCSELSEKLPELEIVPTNSLVEGLREVKDRDEIAQIRQAIDLAEGAFAVIRASLRPDHTEKQIARDLEHQIRLFGGTGCSFTPIVGVGPRGALPHARLSDCRVDESDFVLIDWGARGELYVSDLTRVLVTGRISTKLERVYGVVLKAQKAAIAAIRPGAVLKEIDAAARNVIEGADSASSSRTVWGMELGWRSTKDLALHPIRNGT